MVDGVLQTVAFLEMLGLPYNLDHRESSQAFAGGAAAGNVACLSILQTALAMHLI